MSDDMSEYGKFGTQLMEWRLAAGFGQQADLAKRISATQQTVSRWERGESRPRSNQIPALAEALGVPVSKVLAAAGYAPIEVTTPFDLPFPVDALNEESFERFCFYLLERIYPEAHVYRIGGRGHSQDGADIEVKLRNGKVHSFQCKREKEFGPQKVHAAVAKLTRKAERKILLLARIASPQARQAIATHKGWTLWDKEDIAREVRKLAKDEQRRLVDIFFPGRRFDLLGETSPGPWQTLDEYFGPFLQERGAFNHAWQLVGRGDELCKIEKALNDGSTRAVRLMGSGGSGKTRLLREAVERYQAKHRGHTVRFLSATEEATRKSLEDLGSADKLLIVDDCHDRTDLGVLFEFAAVPSNRARLVLGFRPYGADLLRYEASRFGLVDERVVDVSVAPLRHADTVSLARQVLKERGGALQAAEHIAAVTQDCPLSTVMAAHVVAKDGRHAELAKNATVFRTTLMGRFIDYTTGSIGTKGDEGSIKKLLRILALTQPFNPEDARLINAISTIEGLEQHEVARLIRVIGDGGIVFKRGGRYRLSPDLLADAIIEEACIGAGGNSTGYAERVFGVLEGVSLENLITNLGRLDWRRNNGDPSQSRLLDEIWEKLEPQHEYGDPHIKAVTAVAYYQPARAIALVDQLMRQKKCLRDLPEILKFAAYNLGHLRPACEYLWELGRNDDRDTNPHPEHAIRVLSELCEITPNKPRIFIERVVEFGLSLLDAPEAWAGRNTPYDFLKSVLEADGHTTSWGGRTMTIERFNVNHAFARPLRQKLIEKLLSSLDSSEVPRRALHSARLLEQALRAPMGEANRNEWESEFSDTMAKIKDIIEKPKIAPVVAIRLAETVSWHANYGSGVPQQRASDIINALPKSLEFRVTLAMLDSFGHLHRKMSDDFERDRKDHEQRQEALADEIITTFEDGDRIKDFAEAMLNDIATHGDDVASAPRPFLHVLAKRSALFSAAVACAVTEGDRGPLRLHADIALSALFGSNPKLALEVAQKLLDSSDTSTRAAVGYAYGLNPPGVPIDENTKSHVGKLLCGATVGEIASGVAALRSMMHEPRTVLDLLAAADIGASARIADDALMLFALNNGALRTQLTRADAARLLEKLQPLQELNGHWIEEFLAELSCSHAEMCAKFFMDRVDRAEQVKEWDLRPCNHGPYGHVALKFRQSPEFARILSQVVNWLYAGSDKGLIFRTRASELFSTMFAPFDRALVMVLKDLSATADATELNAISRILGEAPHSIVMKEVEFVSQYLARCKQFGDNCYRLARSQLFGAAVSGERSGTPGEPFKRDLEMRDDAKKALQEIGRFSPGYDLYSDLLKYAENEIKRAQRDREEFDDD